jgi:hypothetical protein
VSTVGAPTLQLLAWIAERARTYPETIDAWRSSCPRLTVWEDALADGLVRVDRGQVLLTAAGAEELEAGERAPDRDQGIADPARKMFKDVREGTDAARD